MQRMFNLDKWSTLTEGDAVEFSNPRPRLVRLEVNAPVKTALHVVDANGEVHFLALVEGRDTVEFHSTGAFQITVEGADCLLYTADGADISQRAVAPVTLTKIVERRRRNPELEHIAAVMQRNMEKRLEAQARELSDLFERRERARAADGIGTGNAGNAVASSTQAGSGSAAAGGTGTVPASPASNAGASGSPGGPANGGGGGNATGGNPAS